MLTRPEDMPRWPALLAFGRLFSHRTWRVLETVTFLFLFAMTALAVAKRRERP